MRRGDLVTIAIPGDCGKPRPALVIQSDLMDTTSSVTVLLLTSTLTDSPMLRHTLEPDGGNGLRHRSQIQVDKIVTVDRAKVGPTIGRLDGDTMVSVTRLFALFLGLA